MNSESNESTLLQQVRVINPIAGADRIADVLISEGKIKAVDFNIAEFSQDTTIINGQGLVLGPGLVDLYSHSGEPGYEYRETFSTFITAAAAGGFTRIGILPDTDPPLDNLGTLLSLHQQKQKLSKTIKQLPHLEFWGAITMEIEGKRMAQLAELAPVIVGFADGYPIKNLSLLRQVLEYLKPLGKPVALAVSNCELKGNGVVREGVASIRYGLSGNPGFSETVALSAVLEIVDAIGIPVHIMRVSTSRGVELIANAKQRGVPVTASTTWMHLLFNTNDLSNYDPNLRLEPPLGNENDMLALIEGVKQGMIDAIAVDHTPYTYEEKTQAFAEASPGVIGLELALPLLWQRFVASGEWSAVKLWQALSTRPQLCLGQQPTSCLPGHKAELTLFDPQKTWIVEKSNLESKSANTPWWGKEITGRAVQIWTDRD
ncbi:dihydroorotase [Pleurocapsales cyanobacterium LEGE 06147]|nr:dihydroorotase [Pleurocapsales cyanobacterium LEGE 06147]